MALKATVQTLEEISEAHRGLYVEKNGMFHLDVEGMEDTAALRASIEKERKARRDAEARAKLALSDEEMEEVERLRSEAAKAKGADEIVNQLKARHQKELEARTKEAQAYRASLEKTVLESTASQLLAKHGGNVGLLMPHIMGALRVEESDGQFQVVPANAASVDDVVAGLKTSYPAAFADSGKSGGGASGGGAGGGNKSIKINEFNQLPAKDRAAFMAGGGTITE